MRFIRTLVSILFVLTVAFFIYVEFSTVADTDAPVITCDNDKINVSVKDSEDVILSHVSASDKKDGDLTSKVIIESISTFISDNTAEITFAVCDSDNNVTKSKAVVKYTDYAPPVFSMSSQPLLYVGSTNSDLISYVSAVDSIEGDISSRIVIAESNVDLTRTGDYDVKYSVTSSMGAFSEITVKAHVVDTVYKQSIKLKEYLVYTDLNEKLDAASFISSYPENMTEDGYDNYYTYTLLTEDTVNYSKPGTYFIMYELVRTITNAADEADRQQVVIAKSYLSVIVRGDGK